MTVRILEDDDEHENEDDDFSTSEFRFNVRELHHSDARNGKTFQIGRDQCGRAFAPDGSVEIPIPTTVKIEGFLKIELQQLVIACEQTIAALQSCG